MYRCLDLVGCLPLVDGRRVVGLQGLFHPPWSPDVVPVPVLVVGHSFRKCRNRDRCGGHGPGETEVTTGPPVHPHPALHPRSRTGSLHRGLSTARVPLGVPKVLTGRGVEGGRGVEEDSPRHPSGETPIFHSELYPLRSEGADLLSRRDRWFGGSRARGCLLWVGCGPHGGT